MQCTLCHLAQTALHFEREDRRYGRRTYSQCPRCWLIFLDPRQRLPPAKAHEIYQQHQNGPANEGYVSHLRRLVDPLLKRLPRKACGLDYGCGPGPTLNLILEKQGYQQEVYDPLFYPDHSLLEKKYDFITCSEVAEHFSRPLFEFQRLTDLIHKHGVLGILTQFYDGKNFSDWHYHRDPTHISFYCRRTFAWIAARLGLQLTIPVPNVALLVPKKEGHDEAQEITARHHAQPNTSLPIRVEL